MHVRVCLWHLEKERSDERKISKVKDAFAFSGLRLKSRDDIQMLSYSAPSVFYVRNLEYHLIHMMDQRTATTKTVLPRVAITFCTQCKWMLRAAYFAQELLSTFGTSIGEIALIPATGGLFMVHLTFSPKPSAGDPISEIREVLIWDRKAESGFPETKILKQLIRNHIEPEKNLGHSDTPSTKAVAGSAAPAHPLPALPGSSESSQFSGDALSNDPIQTADGYHVDERGRKALE